MGLLQARDQRCVYAKESSFYLTCLSLCLNGMRPWTFFQDSSDKGGNHGWKRVDFKRTWYLVGVKENQKVSQEVIAKVKVSRETIYHHVEGPCEVLGAQTELIFYYQIS